MWIPHKHINAGDGTVKKNIVLGKKKPSQDQTKLKKPKH